jgi:hypothetical protein
VLDKQLDASVVDGPETDAAAYWPELVSASPQQRPNSQTHMRSRRNLSRGHCTWSPPPGLLREGMCSRNSNPVRPSSRQPRSLPCRRSSRRMQTRCYIRSLSSSPSVRLATCNSRWSLPRRI